MIRRTKIVATVGPASSEDAVLTALMESGVSVFRLNFSHGTLEDKAEVIRRIRAISKQRQNAVAILGDLQGPKIRVGQFENGQIALTPGEEVTITSLDIAGRKGLIPTVYKNLPRDVRPGDQILLDDGLMELEVLTSDGTDVRCRVRFGGLLKDRKGINLPGVAVSAPSLTEKDLEDLRFCIEQEVDYLALSFVRRAADVLELKSLLKQSQSQIRVISKIEKPEAVDNFAEILAASDGIMVARGDLGVEIRPEKVPLIQKDIICKCNQAGKPVITATQMLESMINNPRPTRAEASDVANAILDGTDAIMLSAETATGNYPVEAVSLMDRVALDVETVASLRGKDISPGANGDGFDLSEAIGQAACQLSLRVGAKAILAFTQTGNTATLVAKYRPPVPIYAVTPSRSVRRRLALYSGVRSLRVDIEGSTEGQIEQVDKAVLAAGVLKAGDVVVITMGSPISEPGTTNLLKVHQLGAGQEAS
ncbi:MAG: pyruvate kinase [Desulfuromonadales bacterium]|nr:pyruvate kinase [Desulfuromonadales bacterium]